MKRKTFEKLEAQLKDRGYKMYEQHLQREDYLLAKSFHKEDNIFENRAGYQILLFVYLWYNQPFDVPNILKDKVDLEVHIDVSRTIDERIDLIVPWRDRDTIEEIEQDAEDFYKFVSTKWELPRNDG